MHACELIQERITRLASGIAIVNVGAATEIEMTEKKHRIEDSLEAVKSAQQEGIVPGGGVALLTAAAKVEKEDLNLENKEQECGADILYKVCEAPLRQMVLNAGGKPDVVISEVLSSDGLGYDILKEEKVDMVEEGIIDPAKVTRCALQNAVSAAGTLITTSHAIIEE